jgi:hypothetical protein
MNRGNQTLMGYSNGGKRATVGLVSPRQSVGGINRGSIGRVNGGLQSNIQQSYIQDVNARASVQHSNLNRSICIWDQEPDFRRSIHHDQYNYRESYVTQNEGTESRNIN